MNQADYVILHPGTGTYFTLDEAVFVNLTDLSEQELEMFNEGSDADRLELLEEHGLNIDELN